MLSPMESERGVVLLASYVDNIYIMVVDVPPHVYFHLVKFLAVFLCALYKLPLKWESSPDGYVTWCEALIHMIENAPSF